MSHRHSVLFKIVTHGAVVLGLGASFIFIPNLSLFDEALLPEISQYLSKPVNPEIEGNAQYHLYGLAAASDKDPYAVGKAVIEKLHSKHANGEMANLTEQETLDLYGGSEKWDSQWQEIYNAANCNPRENTECFADLLAQIEAQPFTDPRLLVQLERYNNTIQLPHLIENVEIMDWTTPLPSYYIIMQMGKLSQARAYQDFGLDGLIKSSQLDMKFWRMALTESQTIIGKMVTIATLRRNLAALSYAINNETILTATQINELKTLLRPLTAEEINITEALIAELRFSAENWKTSISEGESTVLWFLTQPTANTNLFYLRTVKPALALSQLSSKDFYLQAQTSLSSLEFSHFNPYNLGGKTYLAKNNWQFTPYIGRAHDLAGLYSLLALQLELKTNPPQDLNTAINLSPHKNPYTGKPLNFNPNTKSISFPCFDIKDVCRITL